MKISYIETIQRSLDEQPAAPMELLAEVKAKLRALPKRPDAIIFASVTTFSSFMYLYGHDIANFLKLPAEAEIIHLTGGCFVGLQALQTAKRLLQTSETVNEVLIVTLDSMKELITDETIQARASAVKWGDGAAITLLSRQHGFATIGDFKSQTDHRFYDDFRIAHSDFGKQCLKFKLGADEYSKGFAEEDLKMATELIQNLIAKNGIKNLKGLIPLNRSRKFSLTLGENLGLKSNQIHESFASRGHLGCADIYMNIKDTVEQYSESGTYVIYSCGYGYTRIAGLIEI